MKIERLFRYCLLAGTFLLASCSNENDVSDGDRLPEGQYPVTFTATSLEAMATSRATADDTWAGGEEVAVMIGGHVKKYTTRNSGNTSTLDPINDYNKFYWENKRDIYVSAWYPYSDTRLESFTVEEGQDSNSTDNYQKSDFLYAWQKVSFGEEAELTFQHLPAKVVITLKNGDGVTSNEVVTADVTLVNQATASGTITYDGTTGAATVAVAEGPATVTPKTIATGANYQTVTALVVPQQMKGKQFIKVAIGNGTDIRYYYYTPANDTDANLQSGNQYTYDITVKNIYLEVTTGVSGAWGGGTTTPVTSKP